MRRSTRANERALEWIGVTGLITFLSVLMLKREPRPLDAAQRGPDPQKGQTL